MRGPEVLVDDEARKAAECSQMAVPSTYIWRMPLQVRCRDCRNV